MGRVVWVLEVGEGDRENVEGGGTLRFVLLVLEASVPVSVSVSEGFSV